MAFRNVLKDIRTRREVCNDVADEIEHYLGATIEPAEVVLRYELAMAGGDNNSRDRSGACLI